MKKLFLLLYLLTFIFFTACDDDDDPPIIPPKAGSGVYVLDQGNYGKNNATLTYYDNKKDKVTQDAYLAANNGTKLGDTGNDMEIINGKAYLVVTVSDKIEVVSLKDLKSDGAIKLPENTEPRQLYIANANEGYFTTKSGMLYKFNPTTKSVTKSVKVDGIHPEDLVEANGRLFVAIDGTWKENKYDSTVAVFNSSDLSFEKKITVGFNPYGDMVKGKDNSVYILTSGDYNTIVGGISKINTKSLTVTKKVDIKNAGIACLYSATQMLAVVDTGLVVINLGDLSVDKILITKGKVVTNGGTWSNIKAVTYDEKNKKIYCGNPKDFSVNGDVAIFDLKGNFISRFNSGITPGTIRIYE